MPILRKIIQSKINVRFHCPNGLHARFIDVELALVMKRAGFKIVRVSLETVNSERQVTSGAKVTNGEFAGSINALKKQGFNKQEVGVYLMYGLPGQSLDEVREGVSFIRSLGMRINLTEYSPLPQTKSFKALINQGIISENTDPLLLNNTVFSSIFSGYDHRELQQLKLDVIQYNREL